MDGLCPITEIWDCPRQHAAAASTYLIHRECDLGGLLATQGSTQRTENYRELFKRDKRTTR